MVAFGATMSSCTDYLTIIPADVVVEEEYWQTKDDVNGVLATSYLKLLSDDAVTKAIVWGELRSDNMTYPTSYSTDIKNIVEANITDENSYCNWSIYYEAISNANLVLESAPQVVDRDPDFSEGDLDVVMGEMYAMRALCHFYLVRTFRDIPLALKSAKNDAEIPEYKQVPPLVALDSIMADLDRAENMVMKSGAFSSPQQNYGRITKNAVLAIKADVNLWRAAFATYYDQPNVDLYYNECIDNCEDIIANMDKALDEDNKGKPVEKYPYNLIPNRGEGKELLKSLQSTAYDEIFGSSKNSSESIFELQVQGDNIKNGKYNGVCDMYGTEGTSGQHSVIVPQRFVVSNYQADDLRAFSFTTTKASEFEQNAPTPTDPTYIAKYAAKASPAGSYRKSNEWDANWIVYRRTDVLLMMAEAMVSVSSSDSVYKKAFDIVNAINTRSRADTTDIVNPLNIEKYSDKEALLELIRKERLLELSYEGKRWFDLVRQALREKKTDNIKFVANKVGSGAGVIMTKMSTIDGLFMPIHINELRYNKLLKQNPAYDKKDSSMEMN